MKNDQEDRKRASFPMNREELNSRTNDKLLKNRLASLLAILLLCLASDAAAQLKKVRLCAPGVGSGIMHAYVAKARGYFAQEGLDLDVLVARGQICTMALLNGQMELSSNPNMFDAMVAGRFKGKVIYVSAKTLGHRFVVSPEIKSFEEVKQKRIAVSTFGGLTDMLTREILEQHGINPAKDVVLLQIGTPDVRYAALKAGTVKAALLASTGALQAVKEGFRELPYKQPPWISSPITASDELLARERPMVRALLRAMEKGHIFYGQNPTAAIALIQKVQRVDDRAVAKQIYDDDMLRHNPGGQLEEPSMKRVIERAKEMLKVQRTVEINEVFDLSLAREAEADLKKAKWEP
jgi:ABC-type nitrate/sulfonate/bicarbonate transport system substrate-binding protein